jgi:hypothetical protein
MLIYAFLCLLIYGITRCFTFFVCLFFYYIRTSHLCNSGQGFPGAASRYLDFRKMMALLGQMYLLFCSAFFDLNLYFLSLVLYFISFHPNFFFPVCLSIASRFFIYIFLILLCINCLRD